MDTKLKNQLDDFILNLTKDLKKYNKNNLIYQTKTH